MKNLKKLLAVVLVIAMAFSLMAVASAKQITDYSDAADVQYKEAVDLMTGLGIMQGGGGTEFDPAGSFTREMAAKVICYILLGKTVSDNLSTAKSSFSDVEATRWSAPFIEYCAAAGIINGTGDGTYAPAAPINGSSMAKLLLVALGYGQKGEYVGSNWEINTLVKAQTLGILDTGVNYSATATREQVAKYVFNVLTKASCFTVTYNPVLGNYTGNYDTSISGEPALTNAKTAAGLGALTYGLAKTPRDAHGMKQHQWTTTFGTVNVSGVYGDDKVIFEAAAGKTLDNLLTIGNLDYKATLDATFDVWVNGTAAAAAATTLTAMPVSAETSAAKIGTIVKFIDNNFNGLVDKILVIERSVSTLTAAPVVNADTSVTIPGAGLANIPAKLISYPAGLAKDDVVLVYTAGGIAGVVGTMTYVEKATVATGTVTSITSANYTIGGAVYKVAALTGVSSATPVIGDTTSTYYVDAYSNIVKKTGPIAMPLTYGLVLAYAYSAGNPFQGTAEYSKMQVLLADGTKQIYDLVTNAGKVRDDALVAGQLVRFLPNGTTVYNLATPVSATNIAADVVVTNKATTVSIDGTPYYMTTNTVYFYYESATDYGVVVGNANVPTTTVDDAENIYFESLGTASALNAIVLPNPAGAAVSAPNFAYVTSPVYTITQEIINTVPTTVHTYNAIVNGEATTLKTTNTTPYAAGLYTVSTANGYSNFTATTLEETATIVNIADASYILCGSTLYPITPKTQIYEATFNAYGGVAALKAAVPAVPLTGSLKVNVETDGTSATFIMFWYEA